MNTKSVAVALNQVRPNLFKFLIDEGIVSGANSSPSDLFICPNPNHDDTNGSVHIVNDGNKAYCHGCKRTFDIFHLNHWINKVPLTGFGFITNNLMPLCEKYEVDFELGELSEEEKFKMDSLKAYEIAHDFIVNQLWNSNLSSYVEDRSITTDFARNALGMGAVPSYDSLYNILRENFSAVFLREIGFEKRSMFSPSSVIFTIFDHHCSPVGFISRDIEYEDKFSQWEEKGSVGRPPRKYDSSPEKNRIFFKKQILHGFDHIVKSKIKDLLICEGQFDWASMRANGIDNVIALGGSVLTPDHISLLSKYKIDSVTFVMDGDKAGIKAIEKLLFGDDSNLGILTTTPFLKVYIIDLPEGYDPSSFIAEKGVEEFNNLRRFPAFEWALNRQASEVDPTRVCEVMLPFILSEPSFIEREVMVQTLSDITGLSVRAIDNELNRLSDEASLKLDRERDEIVEEALRQAKYSEGDKEQILQVALEKLSSLTQIHSADILSSEETLAALDDQMEKEESLEGPQGFRYDALTHFQQDLNGECEGVVIALGGVPNTGKSSLQSQITKELAEENSDLIVITHTIDDTRAQFNRRLVVQFAREEAERLGLLLADNISLNKIASPQFWLEAYPVENEGLLHVREYGYKKLRDLVRDGRLHIKDTTHGPTLVFLERLVKKTIKDFPGSRIAVVLDNFHKAQDFNHLDERSSVKRRSQFLKTNIAQGYGVCVFSTFEYKKVETGRKPTNNDLRDAVNIEYDINYLMNLYSPLKAAKDIGKEDTCDLWHGSQYSKLPIIEGGTGKNKITDATETRYFKFFPAQSRWECLGSAEVQAIVSANRSLRAESQGTDFVWKNGKMYPKEVVESNIMLNEVPF